MTEEQSYGHIYTLVFEIKNLENHDLNPSPSERRWNRKELQLNNLFSIAVDKLETSMNLQKKVTIDKNYSRTEYVSTSEETLMKFYAKYIELRDSTGYGKLIKDKKFPISIRHSLYRNKYRILKTLYNYGP